jgi:magnesium-transporting ATPase (P-type)
MHLPGRAAIVVTGTGYQPTGGFEEDGRALDPGADPALRRLLEACALCSDATVFALDGRWRTLGDPTEAALVTAALKGGVIPEQVRADAPREAELPFDASTRMMATQHPGRLVIVKGAPEVVLELCASAEDRVAALAAAERMASRRCGCSRSSRSSRTPRSRVASRSSAIARCCSAWSVSSTRRATRPSRRSRGATARGSGSRCSPAIIGRPRSRSRSASGWCPTATPRRVVDGRELDAMDDDALDRALAEVRVFSRVHPAQKLRVVAACQRRGEVVAVTGDGVNDAPALMRADVGIAMGASGTDVAKEAAKIVLTDDNFATIAAAVEEGRVVHRNIKKAVLLLGTTSLAEVLILVIALCVGLPAPFLAVQILWNNLVTEGLITVNLVMEPAEGDEMREPPAAVDQPLLARALVFRLAFLTPLIVAVVLGWYAWRWHAGVPLDMVRSETFTLLVVCEWWNVLNCRSNLRSAFDRSVLRNRWLIGGLVVGNLLHVDGDLRAAAPARVPHRPVRVADRGRDRRGRQRRAVGRGAAEVGPAAASRTLTRRGACMVARCLASESV